MPEQITDWLRENLGPTSTAPLTGTDHRALAAAVAIMHLYSYHARPQVLEAFGRVVACMQHSTRHLAYHAIAYVMDWSDRARVWEAAGLPLVNVGRCKHEPQETTA